MLTNPAGNIVTRTPFFLPGSQGDIFTIFFSPGKSQVVRGGILLVPPFAEEMNKTRHLAVLQAHALACQGFGVLLIDLYGTGDSQGDFGDARWSHWRADTASGINWLKEQGFQNLSIIAVRLGALLVLDTLFNNDDSPVERIVLWQPVLNGEVYMSQFLRLRMAADLVTSKDKISTKQLVEQLKSGESVEVAGYSLSSELYASISALRFDDYVDKISVPVDWIEVIAASDRPVNVMTQRVLESDKWKFQPNFHKIVGEQFWATPEIVLLPSLIDQTSSVI